MSIFLKSAGMSRELCELFFGTERKKEFVEKGTEIYSPQTMIQEYEKRIEDLERLIGHKRVEIALLNNLLAGSSPRAKKLS